MKVDCLAVANLSRWIDVGRSSKLEALLWDELAGSELVLTGVVSSLIASSVTWDGELALVGGASSLEASLPSRITSSPSGPSWEVRPR